MTLAVDKLLASDEARHKKSTTSQNICNFLQNQRVTFVKSKDFLSKTKAFPFETQVVLLVKIEERVVKTPRYDRYGLSSDSKKLTILSALQFCIDIVPVARSWGLSPRPQSRSGCVMGCCEFVLNVGRPAL